jgi:hypothetical protein
MLMTVTGSQAFWLTPHSVLAFTQIVPLIFDQLTITEMVP